VIPRAVGAAAGMRLATGSGVPATVEQTMEGARVVVRLGPTASLEWGADRSGGERGADPAPLPLATEQAKVSGSLFLGGHGSSNATGDVGGIDHLCGDVALRPRRARAAGGS